eukprot:2158273-Pyramimonas_sp.AAC.2
MHKSQKSSYNKSINPLKHAYYWGVVPCKPRHARAPHLDRFVRGACYISGYISGRASGVLNLFTPA